ncbi:VOC family protein [Cochlodiniinecator piscidefendens]|uniref:VOC family protein n=1 Tax=Cochlodiniinecator piscidefendens TaxID=2715756 RepID=UPI00140B3443|nr:VOC family protein [Cochlodiniinecator piscidefendens]
MQPFVEHVNITVTDPKATADLLCNLFDWQIRWQGEAKNNGTTYHVGGDTSYIAVYSRGGAGRLSNTYETPGAMNHIGVVVDDVDATEERVKALGFTPNNHGDYEPGKRFYFNAPDDIEIEIISYA